MLIPLLMAYCLLGWQYARHIPPLETPAEAKTLTAVACSGTESESVCTQLQSLLDRTDVDAPAPPLYTFVAGLIIPADDLGDSPHIYGTNPHVEIGQSEGTGNKNVVVHRGDFYPPADPVIAGLFSLRLLSLACGACAVGLLYLLAQRLAPKTPGTALGAAGLMAFNPAFLNLSASAGPTAIAIAGITLVLYLITRMVQAFRAPEARPGPIPLPQALLLGGATALVVLISNVGLWMLPLLLAVYWGCARENPDPLYRRRAGLVGALPALALLGRLLSVLFVWPWPASLGSLGKLLLNVPNVPRSPGFMDFLRSWWGLFGWWNVSAPPASYRVFEILLVLAVSGGLLKLLNTLWHRRSQRPGKNLLSCTPVVTWAIIVATRAGLSALFVGGIWGDSLHAALPVLSLLLCLGVEAWLPTNWRLWSVAALLVGVGIFAADVPTTSLDPAYERPERLTLDSLPGDLRDLDVAYGDDLFLLGYQLPESSAVAGGRFPVTLYWLARGQTSNDHTVAVDIVAGETTTAGQRRSYPGGGSYPTSLWQPGEVIVDRIEIPIMQEIASPTAGDLRVAVLEKPGGDPLPARDPQGNQIGPNPHVAWVRMAPPYRLAYVPDHEMNTVLAEKVALRGYDLRPSHPAPGDRWGVVLYWEARRRLSHDYTVFVHLLDERGNLVAQDDTQPCGGRYPSSLWQRQEQIRDEHVVEIPEDAAPGSYELQVGLYRLEDGQRLAVSSSNGQPVATEASEPQDTAESPNAIIIAPIYVDTRQADTE